MHPLAAHWQLAGFPPRHPMAEMLSGVFCFATHSQLPTPEMQHPADLAKVDFLEPQRLARTISLVGGSLLFLSSIKDIRRSQR